MELYCKVGVYNGGEYYNNLSIGEILLSLEGRINIILIFRLMQERRIKMDKSELTKLFDEFFGFQSQTGMSENTLRAYTGDASSFMQWLYAGQKKSRVITDKVLSKWQIFMHSSGKAPKTIKRRFAALRAIFSWLRQNKFIKRSPFSEFKLSIAIPKQLPRNLQSSEILQILLSAQNLANERGWRTDISVWLGLEILYATGLRISELCGIRICDWDEGSGRLKIKGKGSRERVVFIVDQELVQLLRSYLKERLPYESSSPLLISNSGVALNPDLVRRRLHELTKLAGISRRITPPYDPPYHSYTYYRSQGEFTVCTELARTQQYCYYRDLYPCLFTSVERTLAESQSPGCITEIFREQSVITKNYDIIKLHQQK